MDQEPVVIRPKRIRVVTAVAAVATVIFFAVIAGLLGEEFEGAVFRRADQIAMVGLGLVFAGGILLVGRPRVVADGQKVVIRNIIGGCELPWPVVRELSFRRGQPWLMLELVNDDTVSVLAVQAVDREHAVWATQTLRRLLEQSRAATPQRQGSDAVEPAGHVPSS